MKLRVMTVIFSTPIAFAEIPYLRGAVLSSIQNAGEEVDILFHNHSEQGFRNSYPLIQYKRIAGKAAIVCVGEGVDAIAQYFSTGTSSVMLGERMVDLIPERIIPKVYNVQLWDSRFEYELRNWLPLNSENYKAYSELDGIVEKTSFLERILVGNILSLCRGVGLELEDCLVCKILQIDRMRLLESKGVKMSSFNCSFSSNISLPDNVGIGKHTSIGFGVIRRRPSSGFDNKHNSINDE